MKKRGAVIEKFKGLHFETEIRFDKSDGSFTAELPPGHKPLLFDTLAKVQAGLKAFNKTYESPGGWRRMLYVSFRHSGPKQNRSRRFGGGNHSVGNFVSYETQDMELGYDIFEERENNPPGKRICRRYLSPKDLAERTAQWGVAREENRGEDESWSLGKGDDSNVIVMPWTEEREAALREIQKAIGSLATKLRSVLERPELVSGMLPMLTSGEPPASKCKRCGEECSSAEELCDECGGEA